MTHFPSLEELLTPILDEPTQDSEEPLIWIPQSSLKEGETFSFED